MQLSAPVTIQLPSGAVETRSEFYLVVTDNSSAKTIHAMMFPTHRRFLLWSGAGYDSIGNWTQAQVEAQVLEMLGPKPEDMLTDPGFPTPAQVPPPQ